MSEARGDDTALVRKALKVIIDQLPADQLREALQCLDQLRMRGHSGMINRDESDTDLQPMAQASDLSDLDVINEDEVKKLARRIVRS